VKSLGVAYLLWLAWSALRPDGAIRVEPRQAAEAGWITASARRADQHPEPEAFDLLPLASDALPVGRPETATAEILLLGASSWR
jgi:hypothetical protein